ncbi:MAG: nucleotidyltransferase [Dysgonamonadaceae bacterium]|jgi:UTP-glucose-1-phosphate uridylyltransferase|nr:nucleotidyltransferase [Dysgonamonadaceae bacterium]
MKPTLFVLAAGMGSRYGGLKQLDGLGPNGETIMDYSIFDALRGGFGKVVFVIRHIFEDDFREKIIGKYKNHIPIDLVFQELDQIPTGFSVPADRSKPWGTNHALLMGREVINEPFAVINADDYYGRESFKILADYLVSLENKQNDYCMIGYRLGNTLSESGSVARGVCEKNKDGFLTNIVERTYIIRDADGKIKFKNEQGEMQTVGENTPVSMNMWGFTPEYFKYSEQQFVDFLKNNIDNPKSEFFIPLAINNLINNDKARVKVLDTPSKWFGVTYQEDRQGVVDKLKELHNKGEYPAKLF